MAIGGFGWVDHRAIQHWGLACGVDPETRDKWFTIRVRFEGDKLKEATSAAPHINVPNRVFEEKLALLKVAPVGTKVAGVGWRRAQDLFYLRIYENDVGLFGD